MKFQAHAGVSTEAPANTMPAFVRAVEQKYGWIELDVGVTADLKFVLHHDSTINRTGREADGQPISWEISLSMLTYAETLKYDFGIAFAPEFRGTRLPLLEDVLKLVEPHGIKLKLDNKFWAFTERELQAFFDFLSPYSHQVAFTCQKVEYVRIIREMFPESEIHYDGPVSEEILRTLSELVPSEQLIVWLPLYCEKTAWAAGPFADEALAKLVNRYARLGIWILSTEEQLRMAEQFGAEIVETNGELKP